jgi:hypothetical protein
VGGEGGAGGGGAKGSVKSTGQRRWPKSPMRMRFTWGSNLAGTFTNGASPGGNSHSCKRLGGVSGKGRNTSTENNVASTG